MRETSSQRDFDTPSPRSSDVDQIDPHLKVPDLFSSMNNVCFVSCIGGTHPLHLTRNG
ncbi:hypothetical protein [Burkholderia cepacia]|uniref:hypothetical protein n=1 Tax=Burkholderia cepacia TaxID=292 RepID=UPI00163AE134|nr:hypothetical protein [Burkholderia cepacia]UQO39782.1 hypothetical protein L0Z22_34230 [Burkholderia cepacia]UQO49370.1 hypothetical protein L0Z05_21650 [Burkholderia cepacia]UQP08754.1 hypothetical protein L0Z01_34215 [Burkholderia cepacia]